MTEESRFVYVTYIATTAARLWEALTDHDFMRRYWLGYEHETDWRVGGAWRRTMPDGRLVDSGEVVAFELGRRLEMTWRHEMRPELTAEGWSVCTMEIEPAGAVMKLTVTHAMPRPGSRTIDGVSGGWPQIISNLKSLIETGSTIMPPRDFG